MPEFMDVDNDGMDEPGYKPRNIDEAAGVSEALGLGGDLHTHEVDGETVFMPGETHEDFEEKEDKARDMFGGR